MVVVVVLVGGQGTVPCSGHWQVVIYKPHPKLLAMLLKRVWQRAAAHLCALLPARSAAPTSVDPSSLLWWTVLFF